MDHRLKCKTRTIKLLELSTGEKSLGPWVT